MTILGKILVFVVLVLALVWNAMVVNAYVTRTNWKAEADRSAKLAKEAADAANRMKAQLDDERESAADAQRVLREENVRQYEQVKVLNDRLATLNKQYQDTYAQLQGVAAKDAQYQANLGKLQAQVDNLIAQVAAREKELDDRIKSENAAKVEANDARIRSEALAAQVERQRLQIQELTTRLEEIRRFGPGGGGNPLDPNRPTAAPEGFRGTIKRVDPPRERGGHYLITFEPGADAGLRAGAQLIIARYRPDPRYVGRATVISADPKEAVAQFEPPPGGRGGPDALPKVGDTVEATR